MASATDRTNSAHAAEASPFFRVRLLLRGRSPISLHAHHAGLAYAVFSEAYGLAEGVPPVLPDGLIPLAPEQARVVVGNGQTFAMGFTLISSDIASASRIAGSVVQGMKQLGRLRRPRRGSPALSGNFDLESATDLVSGRNLPLTRRLPGFGSLTPIPGAHIADEMRRAAELKTLTIRFLTPLRTHRPRNDRPAGRSMFDGTYFDAGSLLSRLASRLAGLGIPTPVVEDGEFRELAHLTDNLLVWLDVTYGSASQGKSMDGAVGRVVLQLRDPRAAELLAWGQYAHVGSATRWGLGGFRIEELGEDAYGCARSNSLVGWAIDAPECDRVADEAGLPAGRLRAAARTATTDDYAPSPPRRVDFPKRDGTTRTLAVPARLDLALQRVLLAQIAPGLDCFFEDSSLAYRAGLGRRNAARRIEQAFREGFVFAVKADFHDFFDSVDHCTLKERLDAYLFDDETVELLMKWVECGAPEPGRGLPTGAAVSPLLSNLFLDAFDEAITTEGGRLVRYADDFMILVKSPDDAARLFNEANEEAAALLLKLNDAKTAVLDLRESFDFLGLRFDRRDRWEHSPPDAPRRVDELGWTETRPPRKQSNAPLRLPGETESLPATDDTVLIIGAAPARFDVVGDHCTVTPTDGRPATKIALRRIEHILALGDVELAPRAVRRCLDEQIPITLADANGRSIAGLDACELTMSADVLRAQVACAADSQRRLDMARRLVAAKCGNYAELAEELEPGEPSRQKQSVATDLRTYARQAMRSESLESLLGTEGAAAARWYSLFAEHVGSGLVFERRVAPRANDPVNVLLNIAQTALHRLAQIACRVCGLEMALGVFHTPRDGHAALASDLQEPMRHLMDRVVLLATREFSPADFQRRSSGPLPLRISPPAARRFAWMVQEQFSKRCVVTGGGDPRSYRHHMLAQARSVRRWLLDPDQDVVFFQHPGRKEPTP